MKFVLAWFVFSSDLDAQKVTGSGCKSELIAIEADIPAKEVGLINIYDKFTFVEVPEDMAETVLGVMHKNTIKGYKYKCRAGTRSSVIVRKRKQQIW